MKKDAKEAPEASKGQDMPTNEGFLNAVENQEVTAPIVITIEEKKKQIEQITKLLAHREMFQNSKDELKEAKNLLSHAIGMEFENPFIKVAVFNHDKKIVQISHPTLLLEMLSYFDELVSSKINAIDIEVLKA